MNFNISLMKTNIDSWGDIKQPKPTRPPNSKHAPKHIDSYRELEIITVINEL